ncbi:DUF7508 domain-containing protein [Nocardia cyriacigeorgica]|uniref:DUF7508 domain-containing protein n=1 Tax=Nocardia cyriacigeorgica TaxID=135487 RepID=UPI0013D59257|nr:hypothetical protein [Nocardia cyriacigeorgica]NEW27112.1 hypothetical protein [Nocardia cyriacigeorgica]
MNAASIRHPWAPLTAEAVRKCPVSVGVYELADEAGRVIEVGYAGGRALFGLRGELRDRLASASAPLLFRYEVNAQYLDRYHDLRRTHAAADRT